MFCNVSGCLTDGKLFISASGEEMVSVHARDKNSIAMLQEEQVEVGYFTATLVRWPISCTHTHTLPFVLLQQVVLLISRNDPVVQSLADMLAKRFGCQVMQVGADPMKDLEPVMTEKKLEWKDVAYMGKD